MGSRRRLRASSSEPRYSKVLSSPVPDPALDSSDHLYQQATPEKISIGAEYYASPRCRSGVNTQDASGCSSNDRPALTLGQELTVLAVIVESLAIGAEPGDHRHVGAVYQPIGAYVLDALPQGRLRLCPRILEEIPQLYNKEQLQVALGGLESLPDGLRENETVAVEE